MAGSVTQHNAENERCRKERKAEDLANKEKCAAKKKE